MSELLDFAEAGEVVLKFLIQALGFVRSELDAEDHVAKLDRMGKEGVFLQFFEGGRGVVVVHGTSGEGARSRDGGARACDADIVARETGRKRLVRSVSGRGETGGERGSGGGSGGGGLKFVAVNAGGDADATVAGGFDANDLAAAVDIDFTRLRKALWKSKDEIDFDADFELRVSKEIKAAIADVASVAAKLGTGGFARENAHGQRHGETASLSTICTICHPAPRLQKVNER